MCEPKSARLETVTMYGIAAHAVAADPHAQRTLGSVLQNCRKRIVTRRREGDEVGAFAAGDRAYFIMHRYRLRRPARRHRPNCLDRHVGRDLVDETEVVDKIEIRRASATVRTDGD